MHEQNKNSTYLIVETYKGKMIVGDEIPEYLMRNQPKYVGTIVYQYF